MVWEASDRRQAPACGGLGGVHGAPVTYTPWERARHPPWTGCSPDGWSGAHGTGFRYGPTTTGAPTGYHRPGGLRWSIYPVPSSTADRAPADGQGQSLVIHTAWKPSSAIPFPSVALTPTTTAPSSRDPVGVDLPAIEFTGGTREHRRFVGHHATRAPSLTPATTVSYCSPGPAVALVTGD